MKTIRPFDRITVTPGALFALLAGVFLLLVLRNTGLYPTVMRDEYFYSLASRLRPLAESSRSDYLYLVIYRLTSHCGDGFLECARILNVFFFVLSVPFIYATARQVASRPTAVVVAALSVLGPINSYTAYFMPEAFLYFCFWAFGWFTLRLSADASRTSWLIAGLLFGLLTMGKGRALFILVGLLPYFLFIALRSDDGHWRRRFLIAVTCFLLPALLLKGVSGYLAGAAGSAMVVDARFARLAWQSWAGDFLNAEFVGMALASLKAHAVAVCLMFSVPVAVLTRHLFRYFRPGEDGQGPLKICFFALALTASMLVAVALFTVVSANTAITSGTYMDSYPGESPSSRIAIEAARLHFRYYNFLLPLLFVVAASQVSIAPEGTSRSIRLVAALPAGVAIVYAVLTGFDSHPLSFVDCPELWGLVHTRTLLYSFGALSLATLVTWIIREKLGARLFLFALMPLAVAVSSTAVHDKLRGSLSPTAYEEAGLLAKRIIPRGDDSWLAVIGPAGGGLYQALFQVDRAKGYARVLPDGREFDFSDFLRKPERAPGWILAFGHHPIVGGGYSEWPMGAYTLYRMDRKISLAFLGTAEWPGIIAATEGLSYPEHWATWSNAGTLKLHFIYPLPKHFRLRLKAAAFGPNVGAEFRVSVGAQQFAMTLAAEAREIELLFANEGRSRTIEIVVPHPTSPQELGQGTDSRKLGIALNELHIEPK